jgi:guanylate kinase
VVTATDRPPRPTETEGVDYYFLSSEKFKSMLSSGEFIEHAIVYGDLKGVPRHSILSALQGREDVALRVDVQGAAAIRAIWPEALLIFLTVKDENDLERRLMKRDKNMTSNKAERLTKAREELKRIREFDYVVLNDEGRLDHTVDTILAIIEAEHHRVRPRQVDV